MDAADHHLTDQGLRQAMTSATDPLVAVDELYRGLHQDDLSLVIVFCSPKLASPALARLLQQKFGSVPVIGCTTAGEIGPLGYQHGTIVGVSFAAPDFHAVARGIDDIHAFSVADGHDLVSGCRHALDGLGDDKMFAMLLIDGMAACEESLVSALHRELGPVPLFGGSAGDELNFRGTEILWDGAFRNSSAVLVLIATRRRFSVFKTEHLACKKEKMVVTGADPVRRVVSEINAEPAAREYARMVGLDGRELTPMIFANYPVVVRVNGMPYVRSIQKVNADESLTFFCAIDEGIVLTVAEGTDILDDLDILFARIRAEVDVPDIIIGFDCILRNLEMRQKGQLNQGGDRMRHNKVVGFNTYGEQFQAMHVNQTFTGVAIGRRE